MYRQILINPDQQDLQRIIWKHGLDAEILTYRLKTVTYGLSNAPFLVIRTLQQLAKDEKSRFPLASKTLLYDTYMDDIVSGAPDLETAQQLQSQLKDALQSCGMNLHKWSSNSPELLNSSLSSDVEHSFSTDIGLSVKTLGISWKPFEDCFVSKVQELTEGFQWNHVPSVLNPADLVSRGLRPCDLPNLRLWGHGPQFLEKDSDGLLRVGGRLSNSDLPYVNKHPAILPGNHNLTVQIIAHFHRKNLHTGASSLLHYLMGNLPSDRVVPDYPFNCSGVDFCGPFMISRSGKCGKLYSDNGKTFVGANKELKRFLKLIEDSDDNLAGFLSAEGIEWKFIPPRAPSFGGLWEASVKSIKYHLKRVVSGSNLTYEEFLSVCIQIEGILNSRPLCPLSSNSDDLNALTPAHFLIGRSMTSVVEPNLIELKENALKKWQRITRLVQLISNKWHRCYLSELQQRNKWQFKKQNVKVGDLVVLIEDNMPTFKWPLGRITEIYSGSDALIRVVKVKTQFGEYKRAISRVCLLPMFEFCL
ncbi:integrase catalytic domain-containing protein [Trichonephila clavipes]|nr:integrase catalytic domain-containing protein [Trichonephila clavipes]